MKRKIREVTSSLSLGDLGGRIRGCTYLLVLCPVLTYMFTCHSERSLEIWVTRRCNKVQPVRKFALRLSERSSVVSSRPSHSPTCPPCDGPGSSPLASTLAWLTSSQAAPGISPVTLIITSSSVHMIAFNLSPEINPSSPCMAFL